MNTKKLMFAVVAGVSGLAMATPSWTTGSCAPADWQALDGNVLANYYAEIEAVGASGAVGPSLGAVTVSPGKTKASLSGSVAEAGTDATACDVYLAIGEAAAVKIAEGVTSAFSYTVENLTPNTTYAYALSVSNNAATVMGTVKNGEFTTLPADAATASWTKGTFMPADWQPLEGNVLANVKGTMVVNTPNGYGSKDLGVLSDGEVPSAAGKSWIVGVMPNAEIDWILPEPVTLEQVRISSCYLESPAFSGVNIASIKVKCSGSDAWVEIAGSSSGKIVGDGSTKNIVCATLSDAENGALAQNVTALKIVSGPAVYINANYYAEIEAVGSTGSDDPTPVQGVVFTFE